MAFSSFLDMHVYRYLIEDRESILVAHVLPVVVRIRGVDHREQEFLKQRCSPHHSSIFLQLQFTANDGDKKRRMKTPDFKRDGCRGYDV